MSHPVISFMLYNTVTTSAKLLNSPKKADEDELMEDSESTNQNANNSIENIDDRVEEMKQIEDEIMSSQEVNCEMPPLVEPQVGPQPNATNDNLEVATDVDMENELDYSEATIEEIEVITSPAKSSNPTSSSRKPSSNVAPSESDFEPHSEFESTVADFETYNVRR